MTLDEENARILEEISLKLPKQTIDEVNAIAEIAGLTTDAVINMALAIEIRRWQKLQDKPCPE